MLFRVIYDLRQSGTGPRLPEIMTAPSLRLAARMCGKARESVSKVPSVAEGDGQHSVARIAT